MSKVLVTESHLNNIAEAIRGKNGASTTYRPSDMAAAIQAIPTGITPTGTKQITQNGTHDMTEYANANVNVPNSYAAGDEGKVVKNRALATQTSRNVTVNGTYDTTENNSTVVDVPNTYTSGDEGKVVSNGALVGQTSTTKNANGTYDTTENNQVVINVPNSYTAGDEGKVVNGGALVPQSARPSEITVNGTYDTTNNNSVQVNVAGSSAVLTTKTISVNGQYSASSDNADGYSSVDVNVPNTYSAADEGKVVDNGALVPQTARPTQITTNGTYDTTNNNSVEVNVSGGGGGGTLPSEYQQVEYLEFTGTQYIAETGINLVSGDVIFGFAALDSSVATSAEDGIMGGNASDTYEIYYYSGALRYYGNITGLQNSGSTGTKKIIAGTLTANGTDFAIGRYSSDYAHKGKIWDVLIYRMGVNPIYRHYVPCYRKADSVAGYFELMRGVFYTNQGTGTIGVGPDVA